MLSQHGTVYPSWRMRPEGQADSADFTQQLSALADSDFSPILRPLHPWRNKLTVLDGVSMASAVADELLNEHNVGTVHALTGGFLRDATTASFASIDQIIAQAVAVEGRINSLELAVIGASSGGAVFRDAAQPLPADIDAAAAFSRLFPNSDAQQQAGPATRIQNAQPSVLDFVGNEYAQLLPRLSTEDRAKLSLHRDLIADVEQRVRDLFLVSCTAPQAVDLNNDYGSRAFFDTRFAAMSGIITNALACDLTRVATLQLGQLTAEHCSAPVGSDVHADFAHQQDVPPGFDVMTNYGRTHAQQFADFMALLDSVPEGNGTLLDNTLVVWVNELATGTHKFLPWPVVIGGGGNLGLQTGRYLRWAPSVPTPSQHPTWSGVEPTIGVPHNRMWISLAQKLGVTLGHVGETQLTTTNGVVIDTTTPLDRL